MRAHQRGQDFVIRDADAGDRSAIRNALNASWGSQITVVHDERIDVLELPALVAVGDTDDLLGLATFRDCGGGCEVVTLDAFVEGAGIGTALLETIFGRARAAGSTRVWLMTTNDNIRAIRFYQRRGMRLVSVHVGAVDRARRLKPEIPLVGEHGIEIHDELEFELGGAPSATAR